MKKNNLIWITPFFTLKKNIRKSKQWDFVKSKTYKERTELFFEIGEIKKKDKIIGIIQYDVSIPQHTLLLKIEGVKTKNFSTSLVGYIRLKNFVKGLTRQEVKKCKNLNL